ncbi:hypothetical protein [Halostella salina]|uniref:hypothetical protein n=1 Tax=Halostella salina TaxID=1547897 RepID=UPI0013CEB8A2|nr:hypothetical protein [Halostella salina]
MTSMIEAATFMLPLGSVAGLVAFLVTAVVVGEYRPIKLIVSVARLEENGNPSKMMVGSIYVALGAAGGMIYWILFVVAPGYPDSKIAATALSFFILAYLPMEFSLLKRDAETHAHRLRLAWAGSIVVYLLVVVGVTTPFLTQPTG